MGCWNTNLALGFFGARGDKSKAFLAGLFDTLLAPLQPVLNAFGTVLMETENQTHYAVAEAFPTGCQLVLVLTGCGLWWVKSLLIPFTQHSGLSLCHWTPLSSLGMSPRAGTAPRLETQQRKGGWMFSRLLHKIQWKAGKGTSWEQLCLGKGDEVLIPPSSPVPSSASFPKPGYSQACLFQLSAWFHTGISTSHRCLPVTWNCIF